MILCCIVSKLYVPVRDVPSHCYIGPKMMVAGMQTFSKRVIIIILSVFKAQHYSDPCVSGGCGATPYLSTQAQLSCDPCVSGGCVAPPYISLPRLSCLLNLVFQEAVVPLLISLPRLTSLTLEKAGLPLFISTCSRRLINIQLVLFLITVL